ncbi:hypothetical protein H8E52_07515 [bacterium]|nr:hypothetical protein [bacterium]
MRVNRWLTVLPFLFLLQISFCGQQDLDTALLTIDVRDDQGEVLAEAVILLNGEIVDLALPITLELDPWISHRLEIADLSGWIFLPNSMDLTLEPGSEQSVVFEGSSLTGNLTISSGDLWDGPLPGAEIWVDGSSQSVQTPAVLTLPAGRDLEISVTLDGFDYDPSSIIVNLESGGEASAHFEGVRNTRVVLAEDYSNTACLGCPEAEEALWLAKSQASGEILPLSCHLFWPAQFDPFYQYNIEVNLERWLFYGGTSFLNLPTIFVDGSAVSDPQDSQIILDDYEARLALAPKLALRVTKSEAGGDYTVTVDGKVLSLIGAGPWRIYYGLAESETELEEDGGNGQTHFQNVVRHMNGVDGEYDHDYNGDPPPSLGEAFAVNVGELFNFSTVFTPDLGQVNADHLFAFVFVQAEGSREVLDAAQETHGGP